MTNLFTLVGEILLRGADEAKRDIQDVASSTEKSSSKIQNSANKIGESLVKQFKVDAPFKLVNTLEALNGTVDKQKKRLDELKSKYQNLYLTQGKNSDEAKKTAKEIEELSKELNDNERELKEAKQASDKFGGSLEDLEKDADKTESKLASMAKKIGGVLATAFAIDKVKDFGVSIVNASAEVSAEMSAFEQIMGDYSDTAQTKLNEIADATGVVSTRLTPYMTSLTAKFKGLGNDIATATDLATRGLYLASDASAFWNKSLDDSMSALNSFINGSYEGGEAIGLFANDSQLAQYAIQQGVIKSTKDWSALDEATKQATRLEYAEAMMAQSGATGQASKESEQYENVMANLAETWRQFKAQIGEPLLQNVVIPAMQGLQTVVETLSNKWTQLNKWISDNKETIDQWIDVLIIAGTITGAYVLVAGTMSILQTVATWIKTVATAQGLLNAVMLANPIALVVALLAGLVIAFIKAYNESETFRDKVNAVATAVKNAWDATIKWFKELPDNMLSIGSDIVKGLWNGINDMTDWIVEKVKGFGNSILTGIKNFFGIKSPSKVFAEIGKFLAEGLGIGIEDNADYAIDAVEELGEETTSGFQNLMNKLHDWFSSNPVLRRIGQAFGFKFAEAVESTEKTQEDAGKKLGEAVANGMGEGFKANLPKVTEAVESWGEKVLRLTAGTAEGQKVALENELKELKKLYGDGIGTGKDLNSSYMVMLSQQIAETEKSLSKFEAKEETLATKIKDFFSGTFEEISSKVNNLLNQIYSHISGLITSIESYQQQILQNEINTYESRLEELRRFNEEQLSEEEKEAEEQKELLKDQLYSGKINYSEYVSSIKQLDKELEKSKKEKAKAEEKVEKDLQTKKDELGRKAFEANKKTEIANVWINTASAILKSYAQMGWIAGSVASGLLLATAGVQTATINQQQYTPALAEGGIVDRPTTALIGEDGKEAVVPLERNLEWVDGLASAIQPVMTEARYNYKPYIEEVRDLIQEFKLSVVEMFEELLGRESTITIDGRIVAQSLLPHINRELGAMSKLKSRGI